MFHMAKMLYVKVNPKNDDQSTSAKLANFFLEHYRKENPEDTIETLDLYNANIPFLDVDVFKAWGKFASQDKLTESEQDKATRMDKLTNQFLEADKVVLAAPFWNLSYPPMLKAYIDTICIKGKTFQYSENGPEGLVPDKPFLLIETRGRIYSHGPTAQFENYQRYLKTIMQFMGIQNFNSVIAEGLDIDEETRNNALREAKQKLEGLSKRF